MRECKYQIGSDKRKISLRFVVDLLVNRVDELFQFIVDEGLSPPPMFNENDTALKNALETLGLGHIKMALEAIETKERHPSDSDHPGNIQTNLIDEVPNYDVDIGELDPDMNLLIQPFISNIENQPDLHPSDTASSHGAASDGSFELLDNSSPVNLVKCSETVAKEQFPGSGSPNNCANANGVQVDRENQIFGASWSRKTSKPSMRSDTVSPRADHTCTDFNDGSEMEDIVHRLSNRMGSLQIGTDGNVRYYGPTSHFNLLRMPTPDNLTVHRTVRKDGQDILNRLSIGKHVPKELENHLLNLYFTWQNPAIDVVDRGMYQMARQQWQDHMEDTPYYSEALTNAMCCLGAAFEPRYHPEFITYPKSVADFFADRAKALLDIELDSPSVATIQAMVVLSGHDIGCKRDSRGWLYSGMAMRLAFDLGLHIDMSSHVADGSFSPAAAALRRMVFWGAYNLDHHWGFLLGRPSRISVEDVTVEMPGHDPTWAQSERWNPYGLPYPVEILQNVTIPNPVTLISQYRVWLCHIMTPLGHVLYGSSKILKEELQALNEETTSRLVHWMTSLPAPLQVKADDLQTPYLPHLLLLQYVSSPWLGLPPPKVQMSD
ncbi:fungal-specific transcription factor domain-containing protein [Penicillium angulare]|uniref:fungal-specific transcription factor domain-containing protein n=1 Tax=Penicillium angulare TaxID=116970 RepID=UPI002540A2C2|nr:fungal-specific transcription factor domain-containing protein [Penicillium angulare]KAJ5279016.1 fungal-specific transcription factor domain-containing protein [Penicillium angulare]